MPRKQKSLSLTQLRDELVVNCDELIERYTIIIGKLQVGEATTKAVQIYMTCSSQPGGAKTDSSGQPSSPDPKSISLLLSPAHAGLVQEWLIFLDAIFGRAILHFLETDTPDRLPKRPSLYLNKIKASSLVNIRESISDAAKESFSFVNYTDRIKILRRIFKITDEELQSSDKEQTQKLNAEMKKHVTIRNVFQHNRGKIREDDLAEISPRYFELLTEDGKKDKYYINDEIILSMLEIESLNKTIKDYSKKFEVLS